MDITDFISDDLKRQLLDGVVDVLANQAKKVEGGDKLASIIGQLSSQAAFNNAFDQAMKNAVKRFRAEYSVQDEELVAALLADKYFWQSKDVSAGLKVAIRRPGLWLVRERENVVEHFTDVLPQHINRKRVDKAVAFFIRCVVEELWTLPGATEIREIYNLQFQRIEAEAARRQVALLEAQLQATAQLSVDVRQALLELITMLEKHLLGTAPLSPSSLKTPPFHNLPQPDYTRFIGRQKELNWLRQRLSPQDRAWQMVIAGIGGVGKSALALAIAHDYRVGYQELPPEERFEAIIWISAKEEVLTITGREKSTLPNFVFRNLEDIYTTIAQTLEREDITRAVLEEQSHLVQKALSTKRTLLIVDNLETVTDERVKSFLRNVPVPTKCIITSREWVDVADVLKLTGLSAEEAERMIIAEGTTRNIELNLEQRQRLFMRTAGLPLPIKLSVARLASGETFDQVLRWLGNATGDLPEYCVKGQIDMAHQRDLNAWKLLLACSLFDQEAGVSRDALGTISELSLADRDEGLTLLQRLSLLNRTRDDRFRMLPMVQGYAGTELAQVGFCEQLTEHWLAWYLEFSQHYGINMDLHIEGAEMVSIEYPNLLKAIRWCREHERWETLLQLVEGTWFYLYLVGLLGELREILEAALTAARALRDERREGRLLRRYGVIFWVQGEYEKALEKGLKAEEIALRYNDERELGRVSHTLTDILSRRGALREAEQRAQEMLERGERFTYLKLKALAIYRLSELQARKHEFEQALECLDRGEQWCKELGWSRGLAWTIYLRGITLIQQGESAAAEPYLLQSLRMATSWNERHLMANNQYGLARVYADTGRVRRAHQMADKACDLYDRLGAATKVAEVEVLLHNLPEKND